MTRQEQLDQAADRGAAIFRERCDGRGSCDGLSDADLAIFDNDIDLVDALMFGFDEAAREYT